MNREPSSRPAVVVSHPAHQGVAYHTVEAAQRAGFDTRFLTGLYYRPGGAAGRLLRAAPKPLAEPVERKLRRRFSEALDPADVVSVSGVLPELAFRLFEGHEAAGRIHDRLAARWIRRNVAAGTRGVFHGFIGFCRRSLASARERGLASLLEMTAPPVGIEREMEECRRLGYRSPGAGDLPTAWAEIAEADLVIAQSRHGVDALLARGVPAERLALLPLGVDVERFRPSGGAAPPGKGFRALFVGNLGVRKGLHHLLEAWTGLDLPGGELVVAGGAVDEAGRALERRRPAGVRLTGRVPPAAVPDLYRSADVFVLPSLSEGAALVVLEAMASGLPCVVSDGAPSVIRDGVEGFIVPVGDIRALRDRLLRLHRDPDLRRRMGAAARRRAERFTWDDYGRRLVALYRKVCDPAWQADGVLDLTEA